MQHRTSKLTSNINIELRLFRLNSSFDECAATAGWRGWGSKSARFQVELMVG